MKIPTLFLRLLSFTSLVLASGCGWVHSQSFAPDSLALRHFYHSLDGLHWDNNSNWLTANPLSTWHGVCLDNNGRVVQLNLANNELKGVVPDTINVLTELKVLNLSGRGAIQKITALPEDISGLSKLDHLILEYQNLTQLPSLDHFDILTLLNVAGNDLDSLPDLSKLKNLEQLDVLGNNLSGFPSLDSLKNLLIFKCQNNQLTQLPEITDSVTQIRELYCTGNNIDSLPSLANLKNLEVFLFDDNKIDSLPLLPAPEKLKRLKGEKNLLTKLPDLAQFVNLSALEMRINSIGTLLHLDSLKKLEHLDISRNPLGFTPQFQSLKQLNFVSIASIGMDTLPPLDSLKLLSIFSCSDNNLTYIPALDSNLLLTNFQCNTNQLTSFPDISHLKNLTTLIAYQNLLDSMPGLSEVKSLQYLDLQINLFSQLPDFSAFNALLSLRVSDNLLDTLIGVNPTNQPLLRWLFMGQNPIRSIPYLSTVVDFRCNDALLNFDDILPYASTFPGAWNYAPQGQISLRSDTLRDAVTGLDTAVVLRPLSGGDANNAYSWFKNGVLIALPATQDSICISLPVAPADTGTFRCEVTNTALPGLTLVTTSRELISTCGPGYPFLLEIVNIDDGQCEPDSASAEVRALGGVGPFTYTWSTFPQQQGPIATQLASGSYLVSVEDQNNCTVQTTLTISCPLEHIEYEVEEDVPISPPSSEFQLVSMYPNPASDQLYADIWMRQSGRLKTQLFNGNGQKVRSDIYVLLEGDQQVLFSVTDLSSGIYVLVFAFPDGTQISQHCMIRR